MPRVDVPVQATGHFGVAVEDVTFTSADQTNNHSFENDGRTVLVIKNDDVDANNVTIYRIANARTTGVTTAVTVTTAASNISVVPPLDPGIFGSTVTFDIDDQTSCSFATVSFNKFVG